MGRATQGVRLITLKGNDEIASVAKIEHEEEEEAEVETDENGTPIVGETPEAPDTTEGEVSTDEPA
jgi:DNA gyrase subunit A